MRFLRPLCCLALLGLACSRNPPRVDVDAATPGAFCEVHDLPLEEDVVPITYGLICPSNDEIDAHTRLFRHSRSHHHAGCVIKDDKWARVSYCPECRKAEAEWQAAYDKKMAPIHSHWERAWELVQSNAKFHQVHPYID